MLPYERRQEDVEQARLRCMRNSAAHVLAAALAQLYPAAKFASAGVDEFGFYYDVDLPGALSPEDFPKIEQRMADIIKAKYPFERSHWSRQQALQYFRERGQDYKVEMIEEMPEAEVQPYAEQQHFPQLCHAHDGSKWPDEVPVCSIRGFVDVCMGPLLDNAGEIGSFKLLRVGGAYWRGDEQRPMLQRVYGTAWNSREELDQYLSRLEEAQKRDHRRLGRELGLFMFSSEVGAGLPLWLPKGAMLWEALEGFLHDEQLRRGYMPVMTPQIGLLDLYRTSGHWYKYRDEMYPPMVVKLQEDSEPDEPRGEVYALRPMNCPHHIAIYKNEMRSYRELPLRLAEFGMVYRYEKAGQIHGLLRSRGFTIDDSHIFAMPEQLDDEFIQVVDFVRYVFQALGINQYRGRVGVRDPRSSKYIGSDEVWAKAEAAIVRALEKLNFPYTKEEGEAGFYGPKLDLLFSDALGREWQLGTIQVDYNLLERFDLWYIGEDGERHRPVMIHRAPGSVERLIAILIEHYAGAFPVWLAPVQAVVIPIADRHIEYANKVLAKLVAASVRAEVDKRGERMNAKLRDAQLQKIPYMLVVGDKEEADEAVSVRLRGNENLGMMLIEQFVERVQNVVKGRRMDL